MKLLLGVLLIVVAAEAIENCTRNGVTCPDYEVIDVINGHELRLYPEMTLVSTMGQSKLRKKISRHLILRLYDYIGGNNEENRTIELMVPVRTLKTQGEHKNAYKMSFFLPKEHRNNPPVPKHPKVFIEKEAATQFIVRSFGGYIVDEKIWDKKALKLMESMPETVQFDRRSYYWAVYDPPVRINNRLNEVWIKKN